MGNYTMANVLKDAGLKPKKQFGDIDVTGHRPRPAQLQMLKKALRNARWGDFSDPGTGKSLTSYLYLTAVLMGGRRILALMPPNLTQQYVESLYESVDFKATGKTVHILNESPKIRAGLYKEWDKNGWPDLLVVGYQMFLRESRYIYGKGYNSFISDEAHALKNPASKTHKLVKLFMKDCNPEARFLPMTGTPMPTTPECAYGLISLLNPQAFRSKASFDRKHLVKQQMGDFKVVVGFKNLEELSTKLYTNAMRVTKEEVLDLEKPNVIPLYVELSKSHKNLYRKLMTERLLEVDGDFIPAIQSQTLRRYAIQICSAPNAYSDTTIVNNTLPRLDQTLDSIGVVKYKKEQDLYKDSKLTKAVIFAHYQDTFELLKEHLKDLNPAVINGKTNSNLNKRKFIDDPTCRVAIIQPQSGGAGLDGMQSVSHNVIVFEPIGSPGIFDQCASRLIRSGQSKVVNVYVFCVKVSVFTKAINTMLGRASDVKKVVIKTSDLMKELLMKF